MRVENTLSRTDVKIYKIYKTEFIKLKGTIQVLLPKYNSHQCIQQMVPTMENERKIRQKELRYHFSTLFDRPLVSCSLQDVL